MLELAPYLAGALLVLVLAQRRSGLPKPIVSLANGLRTRTSVEVSLLLLAVAAAVLLRLWQLDALGFNSDEAVYSGQGASIAGDEELSPYFPVFRAHPLLFQTIVSIGYLFDADPMVGRVFSAAFGVATVVLAFKLGQLLYNSRVGLVAAYLMAVMPYHVIVTRQVLLDGPLAFFASLSLYFLARYSKTENTIWLYATGASMGLTFLAKEPGILFVGAIFAYFALTPSIPVTVSGLVRSMSVMIAVIMPYPLSLTFAERSGTTEQFIAWQLFRRPNHDWDFYFTEVPPYVGPLVIGVVVIGLILSRKVMTWRETLLLTWIIVPLTFFCLWQVKGFQYLLPLSVPLAILSARYLIWIPLHLRLTASRFMRDTGLLQRTDIRLPIRTTQVAFQGLQIVLPAVVIISIALPAYQRVTETDSTVFLAGTGGVPGGREAGRWLDETVPEGSVLLTIGPSMANILQFYGHRKAFGLSVSTNPLNRNPVYEPVINPDFQLRSSQIHYVVWDSYSASRSEFFSDKLRAYADRYHGRVVHTETVSVTTAEGELVERPVIIIYEVRP